MCALSGVADNEKPVVEPSPVNVSVLDTDGLFTLLVL